MIFRLDAKIKETRVSREISKRDVKVLLIKMYFLHLTYKRMHVRFQNFKIGILLFSNKLLRFNYNLNLIS